MTTTAQAIPIALEACLHCGQRLNADSEGAYCCKGCRAVHQTIGALGLSKFYELRRGPGMPVSEHQVDDKWIDLLEQERAEDTDTSSLEVSIQGMHCSACVWLLQKSFEQSADNRGARLVINPALGRAELLIDRAFPLRRWVQRVEALGYQVGPTDQKQPAASDDLLLRLVLCAVLAMNTMIFAIATYLGLSEGALFEVVSDLNFAAGVVCVLVGGPVFFRGALAGLRAKTLHLDMPISVGIILACVGSSVAYLLGSHDATYFDTLTVFIALMLLGRWLQQRSLERAQATLLEDQGVRGMLARRIVGNRFEIVRCDEIEIDDRLLIASGDLVPVDGRATDDDVLCSLDWIDGESRPRRYRRGDRVPAGAINASGRAIDLRALAPFSQSLVRRLVDEGPSEQTGAPVRWWSKVSSVYVAAVLTIAVLAMTYWALVSRDPVRVLEIGTAILVVTCPCAFGLAVPLAGELVLAKLRKLGVLVRRSGLLERLSSIRTVAFDKTGTLTSGALQLVDTAELQSLTPDERRVLFSMASASSHPKSAAVVDALRQEQAQRWLALQVVETPGVGLCAQYQGRRYTLGAGDEQGADLLFGADGEPIVSIQTAERLRSAARQELGRIQEAGYALRILSGDQPERVRAVADELGLNEQSCLGGLSPDDKAVQIRDHGPHRTLWVGDGLNDSLAAGVASCSGAVAAGRPMIASKCDFFVVNSGVAPIASLLASARAFSRVVRVDLAFAVLYNAIAVSLAVAGLMKPWLAAVLMPLSSLITIGFTTAALSSRSPLWK